MPWWIPIIAGVMSLGGAIGGAAISAGATREAGELSYEAWREQMLKDEEQRKKDNLRNTMKQFEDTINRSAFYKKQTAALWGGRSLA